MSSGRECGSERELEHQLAIPLAAPEMGATGEAPEPTGDAAQRVLHGLDRYGSAFLGFLSLPGVHPAHPDVVEQFEDTYVGWYPTRRSLIDAQLETLGWKDDLAAFRAAHGMLPHALDFDDAVLWQRCCEIYEVEERFGGVHAYMR